MTRRERVAEKARRLEPYVPGRTVEEIARERDLDAADLVKLSSNENPLGPPESAVGAVRGLEDLHRYPSPPAVERVEAAAARHVGLEPENVFVTPGADGAIDYLTRLFVEDGDTAAAPVPTFQYYRAPVVVNGGSFRGVPTDPVEDHAVTPEVVERALEGDPKLLFLCSPNNPTGRTVPDEALEAALDSGAVVVLDEAYAEFADGDRAALVRERENLVVLRTMSKAFGLAGLRVGYAVAPAWVKEEVQRVVTPLSVNVAGLAAAEAAFRDREYLERSVEMARSGRRQLSEEVPFPAVESEANFVAFDTSPRTAAEVAEAMLDEGVIVRDCSSFPGDTENLLRISAGTEEENARAVEAAVACLEEER